MGKKISVYANDVDRAWYDSSTVVYSECEDKEGELKKVKVVFKNGSTYLYKDVKVNDYLLFRESSSQGKSVHKILKQYEVEKIENTNVDLLQEEYMRLINEAVEKSTYVQKCIVISAFPGCGKTTAYSALKNKCKVLDMESSFYDKTNFPCNYISALKENMENYDIIFVSTHEKVRKKLKEENIEYILYYPSIERKDEMISLYKERGSENTFIELMREHFEHFLASVENDDNTDNKICLKNEGEFILTDKVFNDILRKLN